MQNANRQQPLHRSVDYVLRSWVMAVISAWAHTSAWHKLSATLVMLGLIWLMLPTLAMWVMLSAGLARLLVESMCYHFWRGVLVWYHTPWAALVAWGHKLAGPAMGFCANLGFMLPIFNGWRAWNQKVEMTGNALQETSVSLLLWDVFLKTLTAGAGALYLLVLLRTKQLFMPNMWLNVFMFGVFYQGFSGLEALTCTLYKCQDNQFQWFCGFLDRVHLFLSRFLGVYANSAFFKHSVILFATLASVKVFPMDYVFHGWILWSIVDNVCHLHATLLQGFSRFLQQLMQMILSDRYVPDWEQPTVYCDLPHPMSEKLSVAFHHLCSVNACRRAFFGGVKIIPFYLLISRVGKLPWFVGSGAAVAWPLWPTLYAWSMPFYYVWMLLANVQAWKSILYSPLAPAVIACVGTVVFGNLMKFTMYHLCEIKASQDEQKDKLQAIVSTVRDSTLVYLMFHGLLLLATRLGAAAGVMALSSAVAWLYRFLMWKSVGDGLGLFCAQKMRLMFYEDWVCDAVENVSGWVLSGLVAVASYAVVPPFLASLWLSWSRVVNQYAALAWLLRWRDAFVSRLWNDWQDLVLPISHWLWPYMIWVGDITGISLLVEMSLFLGSITGINALLDHVWRYAVLQRGRIMTVVSTSLTPAHLGLWLGLELFAIIVHRYVTAALASLTTWVSAHHDVLSTGTGYVCLLTGSALLLGIGGHGLVFLSALAWRDVAKTVVCSMILGGGILRLLSLYDQFSPQTAQSRPWDTAVLQREDLTQDTDSTWYLQLEPSAPPLELLSVADNDHMRDVATLDVQTPSAPPIEALERP